MLEAAGKIMRFMETRDTVALAGIFAAESVVIIDSFPPYLFEGKNAVDRWASAFIVHAKNLEDLKHTLGQPQEFSSQGERAFFSLPVTWEGMSNKKPFSETGGLALVFIRREGQWLIQNYGWAVTDYTPG